MFSKSNQIEKNIRELPWCTRPDNKSWKNIQDTVTTVPWLIPRFRDDESSYSSSTSLLSRESGGVSYYWPTTYPPYPSPFPHRLHVPSYLPPPPSTDFFIGILRLPRLPPTTTISLTFFTIPKFFPILSTCSWPSQPCFSIILPATSATSDGHQWMICTTDY